MNYKKIISLLEYLEEDVYDISINSDENTIEVNSEEYLILSDEEADELFAERERELIDEVGFDGFTNYSREYIFDNFVDIDWFEDTRREHYESYIDDIRNENASNEDYNSRLEEEISNANCSDEEEFLDYLCDNSTCECFNALYWFEDEYGMNKLCSTIYDNDLIDWDAVIEWIRYEDGRGILSVNGEEIELNIYHFAYKIN